MDQKYHKRISNGSKAIQPVTKLKCAMTTQSACGHVQNRNAGEAHMCPMHDGGH
jgi:hypothetical protein